jgi:hypothetical protein
MKFRSTPLVEILSGLRAEHIKEGLEKRKSLQPVTATSRMNQNGTAFAGSIFGPARDWGIDVSASLMLTLPRLRWVENCY